MPYYKRNILILSVTILLASLSWNQIVPFLPIFLKNIGGNGSNLKIWISVIFAAQSLAAMVAQPYWGKLGDNYGRKFMIIRAGFCLAGVYFGMSFCKAPWQLAILRFLNGALTGFIPGSYALIATNTPEEHAPRYIATAETTSNVGVIIGPAIGVFLALIVGYRGSMRLSGMACLISTLAVWAFVKEPNKPAPEKKTSLMKDFGIALHSPVLSSLLPVFMLIWMFSTAINPYLVLHLDTLSGKAPHWFTGIIYSLPAIAFVLFAYRWTRLGEKWGFHRNIILGLIGGGICSLILPFAHNIWLFSIMYFITGMWNANISPSIGSITCTRVDESFRGMAYGILQSAGTFGGFVAPLIAGFISTIWGIPSIFTFIGVTFLVGAFVFQLMIRRWKNILASS